MVMRWKCGDGEVEKMKIEQKTTPGMAWIRADKKSRKGKGRKALKPK